jgi:RND family efflux transporter MFP subunit
MKRFYRSVFLALTIALTASIPAIAAPIKLPAETVTASAIIAPVQTSSMGFLVPGPVKEVNIKEGDHVKAGQILIVLDTPDLVYLVTAAEATLKSAQANAALQRYAHKAWNGSKFISLSGPPELRQIADDQVRQARAALEIAQATLAQNTLVAPYDGTVVSINVLPGEFIRPTQVAIVISTLDQLQIETTDLSERDIPNVAVGQSATIHVKALNQDFSGKVVAISPMADTHGGDVVYKVTIRFDNQPDGLLWGMSAEVKITTQ